jgi:hypothetical protein
MENPLATRTFRAVRAEAKPVWYDPGVVSIAMLKVKDSSALDKSLRARHKYAHDGSSP